MRKLMIIFTLILPLLVGANSTIDAAFQRGVTAYENQEYQKALDIFLQIQEQGITNADVAYNIGNCYFRLQNIGLAILYYKRALRINPAHGPAEKNLRYAMELTVDKQHPATEDAFSSTVSRSFNRIPANALAIAALILFALIVITLCAMIIFWRGREKSLPTFILTIIIVFWIIALFGANLKWRQFHHDPTAVIIADTVMGYSGPNAEYTRVFTIHEGMICQIERQEEGWSLIKLSNGLGGWVENTTFAKVR